jgi:peptidoglycan/xylan/chitin deacetylase (PgdA/CDA1 family)
MRLAYFAALLGGLACTSAPVRPAARRVPDRVVVLTFDDAARSHFRTVAPLLSKYGFGATFFVTEFVAPPFADTTLYMTWNQIRVLGERGFEIGNHTRSHAHVDRMDRAQLAEELGYIEERCRSLGLARPVSFAYPAYVSTAASVALLRERKYRFARVGGNRPYDPDADDPLLVPSFSTSRDNRVEILRAFEQARDGKVVVLTVHGVPDAAHPWVTTPPELFEEYLRYLHEHDFRVVALRDLEQYLPAPSHPQNHSG